MHSLALCEGSHQGPAHPSVLACARSWSPTLPQIMKASANLTRIQRESSVTAVQIQHEPTQHPAHEPNGEEPR
ncbi:hypothetical protein TorRG33x02_239650 [Trema orientale]|uniref:Uncharacterized protein n=1 Tax=Trema orientale TaxID=63057 RepID=A0A2P5DX37_TREOI|nr:hypothetical protein TorRG33x02_239650 [Trema orientale]